jgi:hypothetical protein
MDLPLPRKERLPQYRRGALPPVLPFNALDVLAEAFALRARSVDAGTVDCGLLILVANLRDAFTL